MMSFGSGGLAATNPTQVILLARPAFASSRFRKRKDPGGCMTPRDSVLAISGSVVENPTMIVFHEGNR
jgi:hypothetical protein